MRVGEAVVRDRLHRRQRQHGLERPAGLEEEVAQRRRQRQHRGSGVEGEALALEPADELVL